MAAPRKRSEDRPWQVQGPVRAVIRAGMVMVRGGRSASAVGEVSEAVTQDLGGQEAAGEGRSKQVHTRKI